MKFVAYDGKVFDNYYDCEEYEKEQQDGRDIVENWHNWVLMYDSNGTLISPKTNTDKIGEYLDEIEHHVTSSAFYLDIDERCDWEKVSKYLYEEYGIALPEDVGIYRWDGDNSEEWISLNEEVKKFNGLWKPIGYKAIIQAI